LFSSSGGLRDRKIRDFGDITASYNEIKNRRRAPIINCVAGWPRRYCQKDGAEAVKWSSGEGIAHYSYRPRNQAPE